MATQVIAATGSINTLSSVSSSLMGVGSSLIGVGTSLKAVILLHPVSFAAVGGSLLGIVAYRKVDNMLRKKYTPVLAQGAALDEAEPATSVASR